MAVQLTKLESWRVLVQLAKSSVLYEKKSVSKLLDSPNITLDYSSQYIDSSIHHFLLKLALDSQLKTKIEALFSGEIVNRSENKAALHTALRATSQQELWVNHQNIMPQIAAAQESMRLISEQIRSGDWSGYTNKPITDVINIGIGGSQLGPMLCVDAFAENSISSLSFHFISDGDEKVFAKVTKRLNPETTLFIVCSKSFTTMETIFNLKQALAWIGPSKAIAKHFIAVTAYPERAKAYGIKQVLPIWDWVGGRFSLCSAINLITCIAIGFDKFSEVLLGAQEMDEHFHYTPFEFNLPVNLALFGIWNNNFLKIHQLLILTYGSHLDHLMPYLQQLDMESNGKSIDIMGNTVNYATAPMIWGGSGNQAQHSYYQLLCQGTHRIAADLISIDSMQGTPIHDLCLAQKEILSYGVKNIDTPNKHISGQNSLNHIRLKNNSPRSIGSLISLYEHKAYVQSVIWHINAFDQPGVESSKNIMKKLFTPEYVRLNELA